MKSKRKIGIVTTSRADFGSSKPLIELLNEQPDVSVQVYVGGMHLLSSMGNTVGEIESNHFQIHKRVDFLGGATDDALSMGMCSGLAISEFSKAFAEGKPDLLVLVGDRYELLAIASAALFQKIPIAHLSGGEITGGAIDDLVRHALTKLSHLHFPTTECHGERIKQMGEESWRVLPFGEPALDRLSEPLRYDKGDLEKFLGIQLDTPIVVVTFHPETLRGKGAWEVEALICAMREVPATYVITAPNIDEGYTEILEKFKSFSSENDRSVFIESLGQERYYSLLSIADAMLGNSSSGIWESASFELPVVNVGGRQKGRLRAANVVDVDLDADAISESLKTALNPSTKECLKGLVNPYSDGQAAQRIVERLCNVTIDETLLCKKFVDAV